MTEPAGGNLLVGRLCMGAVAVGVGSLVAAAYMFFDSPYDPQAGALCLIAAALSFGLTINAVARK